MTELPELLQRLAVAFGLGLLVGLQREKVASPLAGIRTFSIIPLLGAVCALLAQSFGGWIVALGLLCLAGILSVGNFIELKRETAPEPGITTEVAALIMFGLGAYVMVGHITVAVIIGAGVAVLLQFKQPLHSLLEKIGHKDMTAIMQFALIALVILPILPNRSFGPLGLINPFETWLVVVLIVGISLSAYLIYKFFGAGAGTVLGGILGGLISSTATTISYAQKAHQDGKLANMAATVIIIASCMALGRVIIEVIVLAPRTAFSMAPPLLVVFAVMATAGAVLFFRGGRDGAELPEQENPAELKSAILFGLLYTAISLAVALTKEFVGDKGLYVVGFISGLTDVDALTMSTAQMAEAGRLNADLAWQVVLIGALSNIVFKAATVFVIARKTLIRYVAPAFVVTVVAGVLVIFLWPDDFMATTTHAAPNTDIGNAPK